MFLARAAESFVLGLFTPLTTVCVIPLYPGFLAFLARQSEERSVAGLAGLVVAGVVTFMLAFGLLFATVLRVSLESVVGVVSPVAFGLLGVVSLALIADLDLGARLPSVQPPQHDHPVAAAFGYGFFFGLIVLPCNPGLLTVFFFRALLFTDPVSNVVNFLAFGVGIGAPLFGLAVVAEPWRDRLLGWLTSNASLVNRATGLVMLAVSVYYLVVVFGVVSVPGLT